MRRALRKRSTKIGLCFLVSGAMPLGAYAGDVGDVVKDLYGGDGILLAATPPPFPSHAPHFTASSLEGLDNLNNSISSNAGIFSFNSTVTGFTFDVERGVPVRTTESLGPLLAERAPTLGKGKGNIAFSYTRIDFSQFEGTDLDDLSLTFVHDDVNGDGRLGPPPPVFAFELDQIRVDLDLELEQELFVFFGTYGLGRNWDVGAVVPIVHSEARAEARASIVRRSAISSALHNFDPSRDAAVSIVERDATGLGDVVLRTKYNFVRRHPDLPDMAVLAQVKLPTGDEDDLLGTGETDVRGLLIASRTVGRLTPHVNLGYEWSTDSELSNVRYAAGFDVAVWPKLTVATDVLGRWEPEGDDIGDSTVDLSIGAKWNPLDTVIFSSNLLFPLNPDEGLRADVIWSLGAEMTF